MDKQNAEQFKKLLESTLSGYAGEKVTLPRDVLGWWWKVLEPFPFSAVEASMTVHARRSPYKPKPADIIEVINQQDGRPSADEAWPIALQAADEQSSAVWTEEIKQAWFHCWPVFESGDELGARMAFRQHYDRLTAYARANGIGVKWSVSLGHDPELRELAVEKAVNRQLISEDRARDLLPTPDPISEEGQHIAGLIGFSGKEPKSPPSEELQQNLKKIRDVLATPGPDTAALKKEQAEQAEQKRREELAEQEKLLADAAINYQRG